MDGAPVLTEPDRVWAAFCPSIPNPPQSTTVRPVPLRSHLTSTPPQAPNKRCGESMLSNLPPTSVQMNRCMKALGGQCIDLEKKCHWKVKIQGLNAKSASLPILLLPGQNHRGWGWHWAVAWLSMGMHRGPVPKKVALGGHRRISDSSSAAQFLSPGPLLLQ